MGEQIFIFEMKENIKNFLELTENVKIEADLVEDWVGVQVGNNITWQIRVRMSFYVYVYPFGYVHPC